MFCSIYKKCFSLLFASAMAQKRGKALFLIARARMVTPEGEVHEPWDEWTAETISKFDFSQHAVMDVMHGTTGLKRAVGKWIAQWVNPTDGGVYILGEVTDKMIQPLIRDGWLPDVSMTVRTVTDKQTGENYHWLKGCSLVDQGRKKGTNVAHVVSEDALSAIMEAQRIRKRESYKAQEGFVQPDNTEVMSADAETAGEETMDVVAQKAANETRPADAKTPAPVMLSPAPPKITEAIASVLNSDFLKDLALPPSMTVEKIAKDPVMLEFVMAQHLLQKETDAKYAALQAEHGATEERVKELTARFGAHAKTSVDAMRGAIEQMASQMGLEPTEEKDYVETFQSILEARVKDNSDIADVERVQRMVEITSQAMAGAHEQAKLNRDRYNQAMGRVQSSEEEMASLARMSAMGSRLRGFGANASLKAGAVVSASSSRPMSGSGSVGKKRTLDDDVNDCVSRVLAKHSEGSLQSAYAELNKGREGGRAVRKKKQSFTR